MPVITIAMHRTDERTKANLIKNVTTTAAETTKVPESLFTILIDELDDENIGCGGKTRKELVASK